MQVSIHRNAAKYLERLPDTDKGHIKQDIAEPLYTIEPASDEEIQLIDERLKDYENDPSSFVALENIN